MLNYKLRLIKQISKNKKTLSLIVLISLILPIFQNCNQKLQSASTSDLSSTSNSSSSSSGTTTVITAPPPAGAVLSSAQRVAACKNLIGKPTITNITSKNLTMNSGLKDATSGDLFSSLRYTVNWGITDISNYASLGCKALDEARPNLVIINDGTLSITHAIDSTGQNLLSTNTQIQLANGALGNRRTLSETVVSDNVSEFNLAFESNSDTERCLQGGFSYRFTVKNRLGDMDHTESDPQSIRMNFINTCWEESRLKDPAGGFSAVDNFGTAVAISGAWSAVVAPTHDVTTVVDAGAVYMYKHEGTNWVQKQKIVLNDSVARDTISAVAMNDQTLVISSAYKSGRGAAYIYRLSNDQWTQIQKLDPMDTAAGQDFGQSLAINDRYIFVGAPKATVSGLANAGQVSIYSYNSSGAVYVRSLGGETANAGFGFSVAADATHLAVGAPQAIGRESLAPGSAYVFSDSGGTFARVDKKTGVTNGDTFGYAVSILQNRLIVGAPNRASQRGQISYYSSLTAGVAAKIIEGAASGMRFGNSVALSAAGVYVGAPLFTGDGGQRTGYTNYYLNAGITQTAPQIKYRIYATNETANSAFGWSIATSGNQIVIGARIKNDPNDNSGAAYIYESK
jgi:hypothetical protein